MLQLCPVVDLQVEITSPEMADAVVNQSLAVVVDPASLSDSVVMLAVSVVENIVASQVASPEVSLAM